MNNYCSYCRKEVNNDNYLECDECEEYVHIKCLKRLGTPGDFAGDIFFKFKCSECTSNNVEVFERQQLPWTMILVIVLYNLSIQSKGLSHHGYFHWKSHIGYFIEKHWTVLFPPSKPRMKNFIGTMSGALFTHNQFFTSGITALGEQGWWKLVENKNPKYYYKLHQEIARSNKKKHIKPVEIEPTPVESDVDIEEYLEEAKKRKLEDTEISECRRTMPYIGRKTRNKYAEESHTEDEISSCTTSVAANLTDFLSSELSCDTILDDITSGSSFLPLNTQNTFFSLFENSFSFDENNCSALLDNVDFNDDSTVIKSEEDNMPRIVQVTNFQEVDEESDGNCSMPIIKQEPEEVQSATESEEVQCEKSLFTIRPKREYPWLNNATIKSELDEDGDNNNLTMMKENDENELFKRLHFVISNEEKLNADVPSYVRRFYRKLFVRRKTRMDLNTKLLDIDSFSRNVANTNSNTNILDRFHHMLCEGNSKTSDSFHSRLAGTCSFEYFKSPYTGRILHPFIYRNTQCVPPHIKLMCELQLKVNDEVPSRSSIDYCYVRTQHIAGVNSLLQMMFWPGIDMSECLSYPDFSVVALYKKLIVGCAFLIPDVGHNEAYVSFLAVRNGWERAGIGKFMLYHLTQTCMGKDITLHVSATNPAICLYQKFGFKIEEVVLDFYDKYLPPDSPFSHHAFFLRLTR